MSHALTERGPQPWMVSPNASAQHVHRDQCQFGHALPHEGNKIRGADIHDEDDG